ncbi:MAG: 50S ribosomal protein L25 [bacterium]|nr:50S ribosomal protein L25 [bacterium]
MQVFEITCEERSKATKSELKNRRKQGFIPAVIYGGGKANKNIWIAENQVKKILAMGKNPIVKILDEQALLKAFQIDPVYDRIIHIDFMRVKKETVVTVEVPIKLDGEAYGVKVQGGMIDQHLTTLKVKCRSDSIPDVIIVDISELKIGDSIKVKDLKLPHGVVPTIEPERVVVNIVSIELEKPQTTQQVEAQQQKEALQQ